METEEVKNKQTPEQLETKESLINALKQDFATTVNSIYVNSLKKEVGFREITVLEQKTLSRIMIDNDSKNRKDIIYDAQCALINKASLDPSFDIYQLTEFDRLKLLIALYQANMFKNDIRFTCEECGAENVFKLDFSKVISNLDDIDLSPKQYEYENKVWKYSFVTRYPTVKQVLQFHKGNVIKYKGAKKQQIKNIDNMSNMDYVNLFIESIVMKNKQNEATRTIKLADFPAQEIEEIVAVFPQDVLYSENGVLKFIINEYIKRINDSFEEHRCYNCGAKYQNDVNSASSFL